ncbi:general substrate transporter [Lasiosphaeris hirsuta]|uniref:General substrate transporter n=1 Tax=Lasiosphaeris hirsuta TaxID=260670 RepID=A0AA40A939_9PEZI|nr:general substrate transporter [Lasiosphaeris hirsuta]
MTFKEVLKADRRLIFYSLGFSGTIIMEGYGLALITYLFSFAMFNKKYGAYQSTKGEYEIEYIWKALLPLVAQLGSIVGILITAPITKALGYKQTTQLMLFLSACFVFMPFFAFNIQILMAGFLLQGIPWGVFQVVSPAYASEIASLQLRPILTTWNNLCWVIGQLMASAVVKGFEGGSDEKSFRIPFALQWIFIGILLIYITFAPESPYWHLQKNQVSEARRAITKIVRKGAPDLAEQKLALMQHTMAQERKQDATAEHGSGFQRFLGMFRGVDARRTEIACVAWLIQALCGASIIPWAPKLFESAGLPPSQALSVNIALPAAGIVGTLASWWLMRYMGRRQIYLWGLLVMSVFLVGCGCASFLPGKTAGWAAGGILTVYTAIYDLTIGPICYSIVSEIPSIRRRAATLSAARGTYLVAGLLNHFLTPKMVGTDDQSWKWGAKTGFFYAGLCILGAVYTFWRIPETNNISARGLDILFQNGTSARYFSPEKATALEASEAARPVLAQYGSLGSDPSVHEARGKSG